MSFGNRAGSMPSRNEEHSAPVVEGEVLVGKYKVERVIGAGGMGVVVAARHLQLDQLVALKFVLPTALEDSTVTERFLREAKAAVRLKSEHVAKVLDVGTLETGAPYIVMEYLEGMNLAEVIEQKSPLPAEVACDYLIQACEALSEAHTLGIVHRDLKPQNLFLTKGVGGAALVKVLDFGISKIKQPEGAHNLTQTATVIGSPLYMAPEQMRSARAADERSDIWALGCVLYELLGRSVPFEAETITDLAIKIVQEPFPPLEGIRPDLPAELCAIVHKCLQKKPADRFQDAGQLASALEPFAGAASRVIADRARKVISGNQKTMGMAVSSPLLHEASIPARAASSPTHKSPTSPEWSDTRGNAPKSGTALVALAAAGGAVIIALLAFIAFRGPSHGAATPGDQAAAAGGATTAGTAAIAPVPTVSAAPPPVVTAVAAPVPAPSLADPPANAAPGAPSLGSALAPSSARVPTGAPRATSPSPRAAAPAPKASAAAKPAPTNAPGDDIPSLR